jgi:subtilisin family serine protease
VSRHPITLLAIFTLIATLLAGVLPSGAAATVDGAQASDVYIVRMAEAPAVAYDGAVAGLKATRPAKGKKLDPNDQNVARYVGYLTSRHDSLVTKANGRKIYDYAFALNGFAAVLTAKRAKALSADPAVLSVEKNERLAMDTASTPAFLGLTGDTGLWAKLGGVGSAGEDVIVGIIDSGIWPEHPSFSDQTGTSPTGKEGKKGYQQIPGWHGKCKPGEGFNASNCSQKLIGAQYFYKGRAPDDPVKAHEFLSPRDFNGHGTHTASTAAGNNAVPTTGDAALFGTISGMAPRARVAAYKVCWDDGDGGCNAYTADSVAAIDQSVADGVDVLNYSISGTSTNYLNAVEVAYLFAADAGVFVATSAGNSGPGASTVAHISPWLASVAAGTHNRSGTATATLGSGATFTGASLTGAAGPATLVRSQDVGKADADPNLVRQCFLETLDPAKVAGKIVLCERGGTGPLNARVEKSAEVKAAGGVGVIIANVTASTLNADLHTLPTVHVDNIAWPVIAAYIVAEGASATAQLSAAVVNTAAPAPDIAAFSSRGPSIAGGGDVLKPDFMAPGVDVLAGVAPPGNHGKLFDLFSGTSMSSPHVAGLAALLKQAHPDWSPAAIRSALATTAGPAITTGGRSPFASGSGQVRPNLAIDPGLVYDAGFNDYLAFLKGQGLCCSTSASIPALDASDLNQPSIAIGDVAGTQTVKRTVTNVAATSAMYTATIVQPTGFTVSVSPASFTIAPGARQTFDVTITRTSAVFFAYQAAGSLTWSDGTHSARSPLVIRPVAVSAPTELAISGTSGSREFTIKTGYAGTIAYNKRGLIPAVTTAATVADDPTDDFDTANPDANQGITVHDFVVGAGVLLARFSLFDDFTDGNDDLDLYLYRVNADGSKTLVGASGGATSAERVTLSGASFGNLTAATYQAYVHGFGTDGPDANYTLFSWLVTSADAGNLTVTGPSTATLAGTATVNLAWTGLAAATKYLGAVDYSDGSATVGRTIVSLE